MQVGKNYGIKENVPKMIEDYKNGCEVAEIAEKYGVCERTVRTYLYNNNITTRKARQKGKTKNQFFVDNIENMVADYSNGMSTKAIGEKYGMSQRTAYQYIADSNLVDLRSPVGKRGSVPFNTKYFDTMTERNSFILGILLNKGSILRRNFSRILKIENDQEWITFKILEEFGIKDFYQLKKEVEPKYVLIYNSEIAKKLLSLGVKGTSGVNNQESDLNEFEENIIEGFFYSGIKFAKRIDSRMYISLKDSFITPEQIENWIEKSVGKGSIEMENHHKCIFIYGDYSCEQILNVLKKIELKYNI